MPKLKTKKASEGLYQVVGTPFFISKDPPPKYRCPQEWSLVSEADLHAPILTGKGLADTLDRLETIRRGLYWSYVGAPEEGA
jgi:hypothetical protein